MTFQKGNAYWKLRKNVAKKHGMSRTRLYRCWADMKTRCHCKNNQFYDRYGGRGITVCDEWQTNGKEVYLGFSKCLSEAIKIQEEGERRVRALGR